jgi:hypothetical protein
VSYVRDYWVYVVGGIVIAIVILLLFDGKANASCACVCGGSPTPQRVCTSSEGISDACYGTCPILPNPIVSTEPGGCRVVTDPVTQVPMWRCG